GVRWRDRLVRDDLVHPRAPCDERLRQHRSRAGRAWQEDAQPAHVLACERLEQSLRTVLGRHHRRPQQPPLQLGCRLRPADADPAPGPPPSTPAPRREARDAPPPAGPAGPPPPAVPPARPPPP